MKFKPILLGAFAAGLVVTAIVNITQEGDKITFAPAPVVETVPAPLPPVRPAPVVEAAPQCPAVAPVAMKPFFKARHVPKVKHVVSTH